MTDKPMSIGERIKFLDDIYDRFDTEEDCKCDTKSPWRRCICCVAAAYINDASSILAEGVKEIKNILKTSDKMEII